MMRWSTKRIYLHAGFWVMYLVWQSYLQFESETSSFPNLTLAQKWGGSFLIESLLLPGKIFICYLSAFFIIRMLRTSADFSRTLKWGFSLVVIFLSAVLLHRVVSNFLAYPLVLGRPVRVGFWEPLYLADSFMDCLLVAGVFTTVKFLRLQVTTVRNEERLRKEKLETELNFLRSQISPHFLFNTLNNIYSLTRKKSDLAPEALLQLSKLLRFILYECSSPQIQLSREIKMIEDYMELEKLRYSVSRLEVRFEVDQEKEEVMIPPLLLLTLVENAFKHGTSETGKEAFVFIFLQQKGRELEAVIRNSWNGVEGNKSIGLTNIERQLALLYGTYQFSAKGMDNQFTVRLHINLDSHGKNQMSYTGR